MSDIDKRVLKLTVTNHPGVMSHVCGLFARRCYNLEGIVVRPIADDGGLTSRIWLLLDDSEKLDQIIRQTNKLVDVLSCENVELSDSVFDKSAGYFQ